MGDDQRARIGSEHRRTPRGGVPIEFASEENSRNYEGEALREWRADRPPETRLARLEEKADEAAKKHLEQARKHEELVEVVTDTRVAVGTMAGKQDAFLETISKVLDGKQKTERVRIGSREKIILAIVALAGTGIGAALKWLAS